MFYLFPPIENLDPYISLAVYKIKMTPGNKSLLDLLLLAVQTLICNHNAPCVILSHVYLAGYFISRIANCVKVKSVKCFCSWIKINIKLSRATQFKNYVY